MLGEDLADELSAAAPSDLVEDGLEVIAHRVWRDVQLSGETTIRTENAPKVCFSVKVGEEPEVEVASD